MKQVRCDDTTTHKLVYTCWRSEASTHEFLHFLSHHVAQLGSTHFALVRGVVLAKFMFVIIFKFLSLCLLVGGVKVCVWSLIGLCLAMLLPAICVFLLSSPFLLF